MSSACSVSIKSLDLHIAKLAFHYPCWMDLIRAEKKFHVGEHHPKERMKRERTSCAWRKGTLPVIHGDEFCPQGFFFSSSSTQIFPNFPQFSQKFPRTHHQPAEVERIFWGAADHLLTT